ncbi:TonB-dependent receptor [Hyphomonas jannaschiana]|uniref:TonB-dependent receptor n=1 Tax=Hyphomonas jannaschiana VP2 TaxID=1280952 RepID=A0A059FGT7_9PROT|nr:TonB-dependent receptor [Hyphomonas jannaschiana]KCZ89751.1 TonB-dependent receptor [Hyphomonas jannaschiana VP2]
MKVFNMSKTKLFLTTAMLPAIALIATSQVAQAQEDSSTENPADERYVLQSVTVTASKREEDILDAPYSISALTGDALEKIGANEYRDYLTTVPGVALVDGGIGISNVIIRGLATTPGGSNLGGTVVTYFDEVALNGGLRAIEVEPVDIDRIEVLRGPQGTYYGAGSLGGTLRVLPKHPDLDTYSAELSGTVSSVDGADDLGTNVVGTVNLPIAAGKAALRGSLFQRDEAAYVKNLETGQKVGSGTIEGGRIALKMEPTDNLDILLQAVTQSTVADGRRVREPYENAGNAQRRRGDERDDTDLTLYNANVGYDFGKVRLDSASGYYQTQYQGRQDASLFDGNVIALAGPPGLYGLSNYDLYSDDHVDSEVFSQELRLTSETDSPVQWIIGAYYRHEDSVRQTVFTEGALFGPILVIDRTNETTQWSGFGEANIDLPGAWGLDVGLRYSDYKQDITVDSEAGNQSEKVWTPRVNLRFEPNEDQLYYFQISKGFRLGGFNGGPPNLPGINIPNVDQYLAYKSDSLWNYEAGTKLVLADGRANLSGAVFYADWTEIPVFLTLAGGAYTPLVNLGDATSKGVEAEYSVAVNENLTLSVNGSYTKTELQGNAQYQKQRLPASPETMLNVSMSYERPLKNGWQVYANGNANYVGPYKSTLIEEFTDNVAANELDTRFGITKDEEVGDYVLVNLRIGLSTDAWDVSAFAKNVFGEDAATLSNTFSYAGAPSESFVTPRTVGVSLKRSF